VDPDGKLIFGFIPTAGGAVGGEISGFAAQGTLNGSALTESPKYFDTEGLTVGVAGQGSIGSFEGGAYALSGPDYTTKEWVRVGGLYKKCNPGQGCRTKFFKQYPPQGQGWRKVKDIYGCVTVNNDSKAGAGAGASITMWGGSYSESYRAVDWNDGTKTEIMGTNVGAYTNIESSGYNYDWDKGLGYADSNISGGWKAAGGVASVTIQDAPGIGGAIATATGVYAGSGPLNTNYAGSVHGGTYTSVTTVNGMNGSINSAGATMSVTSTVTGNSGPQ